MIRRKKFYFIALVLALLIPTAVVFAALDTVDVGPYRVDLVSTEDDGDETTYTYAVTLIDAPQGNGLSHWVMGIESCLDEEFLVSPDPDSSYTTPILDGVCAPTGSYQCEEATYSDLSVGDDPSGTNLYGLKFDSANPQLDTLGETHIFQITVKGVVFDTDINIGFKAGSDSPTGSIDGPTCGGTTAVSLASSQVSSATPNALLPVAVLVMLVLATLSVAVWRLRKTAA